MEEKEDNARRERNLIEMRTQPTFPPASKQKCHTYIQFTVNRLESIFCECFFSVRSTFSPISRRLFAFTFSPVDSCVEWLTRLGEPVRGFTGADKSTRGTIASRAQNDEPKCWSGVSFQPMRGWQEATQNVNFGDSLDSISGEQPVFAFCYDSHSANLFHFFPIFCLRYSIFFASFVNGMEAKWPRLRLRWTTRSD